MNRDRVFFFLVIAIVLMVFSRNSSIADVTTRSPEQDADLVRWMRAACIMDDKSLVASLYGTSDGRTLQRRSALGFGAEMLTVETRGAYARFLGQLLTQGGLLVEARLVVESERWRGLQRAYPDITDAERGVVERRPAGLACDRQAAERLVEFRELVASRLGPQREVRVPHWLRREYGDLLSPFSELLVGRSCDYGGLPPPSQGVIDRLVSKKRVDILENVLRGYNPEGRVWAVIGLRLLVAQGLDVSESTARAMDAVSDLGVPINGCLDGVVEPSSARAAIDGYLGEKYGQ